eukprot:TRINITY_DN43048_c0_g1_i1.p1 TRINITY_DN43048_c0_g1~~TRINITY_DN43048_c0_g1_i1.p1  ORF type:complete len:379 (-),score=60.26 TRINITY_DN43048_c0_g1_i1:6-1142(-)
MCIRDRYQRRVHGEAGTEFLDGDFITISIDKIENGNISIYQQSGGLPMKKRILSYLLFVSILITLSSCAGSKLSVNKGDISIKKNDNGYSVIANGIYEGVEILFDGIIDMEEVRTSSDVLKIVQNSNGKTYVAVCKTDEVFKSGSELMLLEVENVPNVLETICVRKSSASNFKVNSRDANPILLGDFDGNQIVNLIDFMIFRQKYRTATGDGVYEELYDISPAEDVFDGIWEGIYDTKLPDGVVNILDFIIFKRNYKKNTSGVVEGPVVIDERLSSVCEGMTIAPNSVIRVAWKKIKGKSMMCNVKLYKNEELVQNIINVPEADFHIEGEGDYSIAVSYTHLRAHETSLHLVCRLLLEKKKKNKQIQLTKQQIRHHET